jgi:hypothetical protein
MDKSLREVLIDLILYDNEGSEIGGGGGKIDQHFWL